MIETALAVRLPAGANFCNSSTLSYYRSARISEDVATGVHVSGSCRLFHSCASNSYWKRCQRLNNGSLFRRNNLRKNSIRASAEHLGSASDPIKPNGRLQYHPSEELAKALSENAEDVRLTAAETTRTIIEVNSRGTVMFAGLINDEVQENIIWPELPYVTDENGNIYFVKNTEETMQNLTSENNFVQVIVGIDTMEMINEIELFGPSEVDFGFEEIDEGTDFDEEDESGEDEDEDDNNDEADDADDEYDADWVSVIEDEDDHNDSDETLGDWAKLETMRSSHPMNFANKLAEVASDDPVDWMEQPPATIVIQGFLRPAFSEEHTVIQRHLSSRHSSNANTNEVQKLEDKNLENHDRINCHGQESSSSKESLNLADRLDLDISTSEASFFRLEMIKIQLFTGHAHPTTVEVEDVIKAQPDAIAHSAGKIMSRLSAGGEKITQALKTLCWKCKGIQVEEAVITGIDSLGFDVRVCSGTQVQTLRFSFDARATSEYSAERLLNDLLFPRINSKSQRTKQT